MLAMWVEEQAYLFAAGHKTRDTERSDARNLTAEWVCLLDSKSSDLDIR